MPRGKAPSPLRSRYAEGPIVDLPGMFAAPVGRITCTWNDLRAEWEIDVLAIVDGNVCRVIGKNAHFKDAVKDAILKAGEAGWAKDAEVRPLKAAEERESTEQ